LAHATPKSILIIRPSALGDVARSVPVLASLRAAYPSARIDWLVRPEFAPIIAHHPGLSNVVVFPRRELNRWIVRLQWGKVRAFARTLREPAYDLVLDCQGLMRSALLARVTGAARRIGDRNCRERLAKLGMTELVRTPKVTHTVDKMLALVEGAGVPAKRDAAAMRLYTSAADRAWLAAQAFAGRRYAVLAPTSAWPAKEWPVERFAALAQHLASKGVATVLVGAKNERVRIGPVLELAQRSPLVLDRVGETSVGQLMAIIEASSLVVANDSASLHIAVGFDRPLIALLGPTDPKLACPYGRLHDVVQHVREGDEFYFRDDRSAGMIGRITLDEVVARADARLGS
jgi:lipopolysaccharide heptosyltransferase I